MNTPKEDYGDAYFPACFWILSTLMNYSKHQAKYFSKKLFLYSNSLNSSFEVAILPLNIYTPAILNILKILTSPNSDRRICAAHGYFKSYKSAGVARKRVKPKSCKIF